MNVVWWHGLLILLLLISMPVSICIAIIADVDEKAGRSLDQKISDKIVSFTGEDKGSGSEYRKKRYTEKHW